MSEVRCYRCGKVIENENDMVVKSVQVGWFSSERKPFHLECWRVFHGRRRKKDAIGYAAILDFAILIFFGGFLSFIGTVGLVAIGLCIALLIYLIVAYYRIEE